MKNFLYLMVATSFLAADLISINVKVMELSIFRISLYIITFFLFLEYIKTDRKINFKSKTNQVEIIKYYLFWLVYSLFTLAWVQDYLAWIRTNFFIANGFLGILILSTYLKSKEDFRKLFTVVFWMIVMHNLIGWSELLTGNYLFADLSTRDIHNQFAKNPAARVPISMLGNQNDYATLLVIGIFITYIVFLNTKDKRMKALSLLTIISSVILVYETDSRANMLGLALGVFALIYFKYLGKMSLIERLIICLGAIVIIFNPVVLESILQYVGVQLSKGTDLTRLNLIKNGLYFLAETFGFGVGTENIEYWMGNRNIYAVGKITNMHNWWMEILTSYGIIIFVGYIWIYIKKMKVLYKSYKNSDNLFIKNTSIGLLAALISFIISSISSSSNMGRGWLWIFWAVTIAYIGFVESIEKASISK